MREKSSEDQFLEYTRNPRNYTCRKANYQNGTDQRILRRGQMASVY